jgi:hypothetical protein
MLEQKGTTFLRLLLNKYYSGKGEQLAKIMPKEDWEALQAISFTQKEPELLLFKPNEWFASLDLTWIKPTLESFPKELQEVYKKAFPKELSETPEATPFLNKRLQEFLLDYLHRKWNEQEVKPKELLAQTELSNLLAKTHDELLEIIDLLSMYDLVEEMRHVVDKKLLQAVLQHLSTTQQHYLRVLLRQKSRQQPSTLSIKELMREGKKFSHELHKFGLQKFTLALSGLDDDFIWHLTHLLDLNRAKFLKNLIQKQEVPNSTRLAKMQVQHIIQFLKTEATP